MDLLDHPFDVPLDAIVFDHHDDGDDVSTTSSSGLLTIDSLPPEILSAIMTFVPAVPRNERHTPAEVRLSHVSRHWRNVALATPQLWTCISIYSERSLAAAPVYIARSGTVLLLNIRVDIYTLDKAGGPENGATTSEVIYKTRDLLRPIFHRVCGFVLFTYSEHTLVTLLRCISKNSTPALEQMRMIYARPVRSPSTLGPLPRLFAHGMPKIRLIESDISGCFVPETLTSLTALHLHSLTHSGTFPFETLRELLKAPKCLQSLSLQGSMDHVDWPLHTNSPVFTLPDLRYLRIMDDGTLAVKFLLSVDAPKLESLWLDTSSEQYRTLFEAPQIVQRSDAGTPKFGALRHLTWVSYTFGDTIKLAALFPTVTHLHFPHAIFTFHSKNFRTALKNHWGGVHTLVLSMPRDALIGKMLDSLLDCTIPDILVDEDMLKLLRKRYPINPIARRAKSMQGYSEYWWDEGLKRRFGEL